MQSGLALCSVILVKLLKALHACTPSHAWFVLFFFFKNEKKEAFIVLKKGTQVSIVEAGYEVKALNYNKK